MKFKVSSAFKVDRKSNTRVDATRNSKAKFWRRVEEEWEGLKGASGCYVFALSTSGGPIPWYVGRAERQSFEKEIFAVHKLHQCNDALADSKGTPYIFLLPRLTPGAGRVGPPKTRILQFVFSKLSSLAWQFGGIPGSKIQKIRRSSELLVFRGS